MINTKSSHIKSDSYKDNEVVSRINNYLIDKTNTYLNSEFALVDDLVKTTFDD